MNLGEYQTWVHQRTAKHWDLEMHGVIGLMSEVGEIADAIKKEKAYGRKPSPVDGGLLEEAGDVLFYLSMLLTAKGHSLQEAIDHNVQKLTRRYDKGHFTAEDALERKDKK